MTQEYDVVIVGAGLSGIGSACKLSMMCPNKKYAVLEGRADLGGTWDLFKYPGVRSDSDMFTFGYAFRPWMEGKVLADGPSIKQYVQDTADEFGVTPNIQFNSFVADASWSTLEGCWTLTVKKPEGEVIIKTKFLIQCSGYYDYKQAFTPDYPGVENYQGEFIHPQFWPENLDYSDKTVTVIGSGATAVTIVPVMAETAKHVTMLQRSPSYVASLPAKDKLAVFLAKILPTKWVHRFMRWRNMSIHRFVYKMSVRFPDRARRFFQKGVRKLLPEGYDMKHFTPKYNPWEERLCMVPDGNLFKAIGDGNATVETDHIERFTETGIQLKSGKHLDSDIVVSATGLKLDLLSGMKFSVDGEERPTRDLVTYKAVMVADAPNVAIVFGYTNYPWTLKCDIATEYICRLLKHMDENGYSVVVPRAGDAPMSDESVMASLQAGYVQRGEDILPRQGEEYPWKVTMDYKFDKKMLTKGPIEDKALEFSE